MNNTFVFLNDLLVICRFSVMGRNSGDNETLLMLTP